jgi:AAA+ superfamily predicted ATPase
MKFEDELRITLQARFTLIVVVTTEEERAIETIKSTCDADRRTVVTWDAADGFKSSLPTSTQSSTVKDPLSALEYIEKSDGTISTVFILKDFHEAWDNPLTKRKLRNISQRARYSKKTLIITTPNGILPDELRDEAIICGLPLPNSKQLTYILQHLIQTPGVKSNLTRQGLEKMAQAALGLTAAQAQRAFSRMIVSSMQSMSGVIDERGIDIVTEEKKQLIRENESLEFYSSSETADDVGGLNNLKKWLRMRERAFTLEAQEYGLPTPKGIALIGIPGTGKSLTAKMIAGLWHLPLLRLDVGSLFGSLVGESEERTRRVLSLVQTIAPCILWIDEMEKALAHGGLDSGTSTRVFGSILTWMQEKTAPVFVVATANDISSLPPELLRRGRFDEIFFLDLPVVREREEIIKVHLHKRGRLHEDYDTALLAKHSEGYTGAEIEQAIIDAMYIGFNEGREFSTNDVLEALKRQIPLSVSQRETIDALRNWLREGRAQSGSDSDNELPQNGFIPLDFNPRD